MFIIFSFFLSLLTYYTYTIDQFCPKVKRIGKKDSPNFLHYSLNYFKEKPCKIKGIPLYLYHMKKWILTKLSFHAGRSPQFGRASKAGHPVIIPANHPDYVPTDWDIKIGQACFDKNLKTEKIQNIEQLAQLVQGFPIYAFVEDLWQGYNPETGELTL